MALGASSYTYAEATRTQQLPDWIASHTRAFAFFGGVPAAVVCDQLKSGVTVPCRYEPGVQRLYAELGTHYGTTILPARPARPRDKAKVEVAVQVAERWIVARLRHETFFTLDALNERIAELLVELNAKPMRHYGGASRADLFARLDQPALRPLPPVPFEYAEWKHARVNLDYHIAVEHHAYSVPHALVHEAVEVRLTATALEVFHAGTGWPPIGAATSAAASRPTRPTCRRPTKPTTSGAVALHRLGGHDRARRPPPSSRRSSPTARIPSRAIAPVSASSGSPNATTPAASKPRVRARSPPAPARIGMSTRSCAAASIARPTPPPRPRRSTTRTSGAATTTTEEGATRCSPTRPSRN